MKQLLIWLIRGYKKAISPLFVGSCRFSPSCSEYAEEALREYGVMRGAILAIWRILRCNPFSAGGYDPVIKRHAIKARSK